MNAKDIYCKNRINKWFPECRFIGEWEALKRLTAAICERKNRIKVYDHKECLKYYRWYYG